MAIRHRISKMAIVIAGASLFTGPVFAQEPQPAMTSSTAEQPESAQRPNVLVWMLDDVGFAQFSCFGGPVATPNIDRVAKMGLRYTNYRTASVCSASRASFLTGRMPHSVGIGSHSAVALPFPGYKGDVPPSAGTIAHNLRAGGYTTYAIGKWDHLLSEEQSPAGPFEKWPLGQGFDRFYGFLRADTDNWNPLLVQDNTFITKPDKPNYHLNIDMADQAIGMIRQNQTQASARPFFLYWATGTAHAPHHAPADWIAKYRGKFDMGWDKVRETVLKRQKAAGLVPRSTTLAPRPEGMPAWNTLSADKRKLYARQMEVFAASLEFADAQFGRILDHLEASGEMENTIVVITSDNGASAEGAYHGMFTEALLVRDGMASFEENMRFYDKWGGPLTYPNYSFGWTVAGNTPFRYFKHTTHEGGIHVPLVVSWPEGIAARGELRRQFTHVSDVAPTLLEASRVPLAPAVNNVEQRPMEGTSFAYSFSDAKAPGRKGPQYFEMFGDKGLVDGQWAIVTSHRLVPWDMTVDRPIVAEWELYDLSVDPGQTRDLAERYPERVARMARIFDEQAKRYNVTPLHNIAEGNANTARKFREAFAARQGKWRFGGPARALVSPDAPPVFNLGFAATMTFELTRADTSGPVFAAGGRQGGLAFYLSDNRPVFVLSSIYGDSAQISAERPLNQGVSSLELVFARSPQGGDAKVSILDRGNVIAQGTVPAAYLKDLFSFEPFEVGFDGQTAVLDGARADTPFPGTIRELVFDFLPRPSR